jgi:hypothetical protein
MSQSESKTMPEAVEYWIEFRNRANEEFTQMGRISLRSIDGQYIHHVISFDAYSALKAECENLKKQVLGLQASNEVLKQGYYKDHAEMFKAEWDKAEEKIAALTAKNAALVAENEKLKYYQTQWQSIAGKANLKHLVASEKHHRFENANFRAALEKWIEWETEQISKEGPYLGKAINELINNARAALSKHDKKD